jgi:hypothetical protein
MNTARCIVVGVLILSSINSLAGPRDDVKEIAGLISERYFDSARGAAIAKQLTDATDAGAFDRYTRSSDLAVELTSRLKPLDAHFNVMWDERRVGAAPPPPGPRPRPQGNARENFGFRSVERLPGNLGYIDLRFEDDIDFSDSESPARAAADAALALVRGADTVILDLRNNGGGAPSMVGYLVSAFVKPDANIYNTFHSRDGTQSEAPRIKYAKPMLDVPLYVLTSGRTGSAGESIAFTLQSSGRAKTVGEASAGAANPGGAVPTRSGFSVFISMGSPKNPLNGRNWEGEGVQPDIAVPQRVALTRAEETALESIIAKASEGAAKTEARWVLESLRANTQPYKPAAKLSDYTGTYGLYQLEVKNDVLLAKRARWEPIALTPLAADLFVASDDPLRRFAFEREGGRVIALTIEGPGGSRQRISRL